MHVTNHDPSHVVSGGPNAAEVARLASELSDGAASDKPTKTVPNFETN